MTLSVLFMPSGNMLSIEIDLKKMQFSWKNYQIRRVGEFFKLVLSVLSSWKKSLCSLLQ